MKRSGSGGAMPSRRARGRMIVPLIFGIASIALPAAAAGAVLQASGHALLCNRSPSVPMGFYRARVGAVTGARVGEYVCLLGSGVHAPIALREAIAQGRVPAKWKYEPLLKIVTGVAGDEITYENDRVQINGTSLERSTALLADDHGHPLPRPPYPLVLAPGTVWLSSTHERGFDSRYFGPVSLAALSCVAAPLWTE